jgi:hypothetical protein
MAHEVWITATAAITKMAISASTRAVAQPWVGAQESGSSAGRQAAKGFKRSL